MASSRYESVPVLVEYLRKVNPKTVLDLGVGFGKMGWLIREYLEAWNDRVTKDQWKIWVVGMEVFEGYHKDGLQKMLYNEIHYGDLNTADLIGCWPGIAKYDIVTAIDVIEHLPKENSIRVLKDMKKITNNILLSIPIGKRWLRNSYGQNPYEAHLSYWTFNELNTLGYKTIHKYSIPDGREMGVFTYENIS